MVSNRNLLFQGSTPLKTNMTLENHNFQYKIHLKKMVDFPLSCSFREGILQPKRLQVLARPKALTSKSFRLEKRDKNFLKKLEVFIMAMAWGDPRPTNNGKWRFMGCPSLKMNRLLLHCEWVGGTTKLWLYLDDSELLSWVKSNQILIWHNDILKYPLQSSKYLSFISSY